MTAASFLQNMAKEKTEKGLDMTEDRKTKKTIKVPTPHGVCYTKLTKRYTYMDMHVYNLKIMKFIIQTKF